MSGIEDRVKNLDDRVKSLESKFNFAVTLALFLGVSVAGLGGWVKKETKTVSDLNVQIDELAPIVKGAKAQLQKTGQEQLDLIKTKAEPIVAELSRENFEHLSGALRNGSQGRYIHLTHRETNSRVTKETRIWIAPRDNL